MKKKFKFKNNHIASFNIWTCVTSYCKMMTDFKWLLVIRDESIYGCYISFASSNRNLSFVPCLIYFTSMFLVSISVILKIRRTVSDKCLINCELVLLEMLVSEMHILIYKLQCIKSIYRNKTFSKRTSKLSNIHITSVTSNIMFNMMTFVIFNFMLFLSCFWINHLQVSKYLQMLYKPK